MNLSPNDILLVVNEGYTEAAQRLGVGRSTLFDSVHKPENLNRYRKLQELHEKKKLKGKKKAGSARKSTASVPAPPSSPLGPQSSTPTSATPTEPAKEELSLEEAIASLPYPFHPASMIFPLGGMDPLLSLAEKIKGHGLKKSIELLDDKILTGRDLALACFFAGVKPKYAKLRNIAEPYRHVIDAHLPQNMSKSSLACCAVLTLPLHEAAARERQLKCLKRGLKEPVGLKVGQRESGGRSAQLVADIFGVSRDLVNQAKKLRQDAPALFAQVHNGKLSINAAKVKGGGRATKADSEEKSEVAKVATKSVSAVRDLLAFVRDHRAAACVGLESAVELISEIERRLEGLVG